MVSGSLFFGIIIWFTVYFGHQFPLLSVSVDALETPFSIDLTKNDLPILSKKRVPRSKPSQVIEIDDSVLHNSVNFARGLINRMSRLETNVATADIKVRQGTPTYGQFIESFPNEKAISQGKDALTATKATMYIVQHKCQRYGLSRDECSRLISSLSLNSTSLGSKCQQQAPETSCSKYLKYRASDGSCNNLKVPSLGKSFTGYRRLIGPHYGDGIQHPRYPKSGESLPSARKISVAVTETDSNTTDPTRTLAVMVWTQFVEHDLAYTAVSKMVNTNESILCCDHDGSYLAPRYIHPFCMSINIPEDDPFYSEHDVNCMSYVRSLTAVRKDCKFGAAEQINQATHFLDGSLIYGATSERAQSLRSYSKGQLKSNIINGRSFLPVDTETSECQIQSGSTPTCYKSGDTRANAHPHLAVMHLLWLREHNRIAAELEALNPHWNDEKLFSEAKRIVIAEIQHITYKEWLPLTLGDKYVKNQGFGLKSSGYSDDYNESADISVSNSFATAALRFSYSMMDGDMKLYKEDRDSNSSIELSSHFNKPRIIEQHDNYKELLRGLITQRSLKNDLKLINDVTRLLYRGSSEFGLDVLSLDIQRGRDHGIPGYNYYRQTCGLPKAKHFKTFEDHIPKSTVEKMKSVYSHPDDVDLVVGGIAEKTSDGSLVGPTFQCIIGEQMLKTKQGDRYFYDVGQKENSFTESQLAELRKTSLARVICDNSDGIKSLQPKVFKISSSSNSLVSCQESENIPSVSLTSWREVPDKK